MTQLTNDPPDGSVQRRFAYEHPENLDRLDQQPEVGDDEDDNGGTPSNSEGRNTPSEGIDGEDLSSCGTSTRPRKRKRISLSVSAAFNQVSNQKGNDFWSLVDSWFLGCVQQSQLGSSWSSPGWTK